jgi:hypothetical protein
MTTLVLKFMLYAKKANWRREAVAMVYAYKLTQFKSTLKLLDKAQNSFIRAFG